MISKVLHASLFVLDQNSAYDFYVNKLGFEVRADNPVGPDFRWLTVNPKEQPNFELILMPVTEGMMFSKEAAQAMRNLLQMRGLSGLLGLHCHLFNIRNVNLIIRRSYLRESLRSK